MTARGMSRRASRLDGDQPCLSDVHHGGSGLLDRFDAQFVAARFVERDLAEPCRDEVLKAAGFSHDVSEDLLTHLEPDFAASAAVAAADQPFQLKPTGLRDRE